MSDNDELQSLKKIDELQRGKNYIIIQYNQCSKRNFFFWVVKFIRQNNPHKT